MRKFIATALVAGVAIPLGAGAALASTGAAKQIKSDPVAASRDHSPQRADRMSRDRASADRQTRTKHEREAHAEHAAARDR
jgi:hypothetical protein